MSNSEPLGDAFDYLDPAVLLVWRIRPSPRKPLPERKPSPEMVEADRL